MGTQTDISYKLLKELEDLVDSKRLDREFKIRLAACGCIIFAFVLIGAYASSFA